MDDLWRIDLHSHTLWSKDCLTKFETIASVCKQRGVNKIAITDHNTADGALAFQKIAPELVIVGEEIMTTQGELLAYFVRESIPARLTPQETIRRLRDQGAVISVSHPFDRWRRGAWHEEDLRAIIDQVDAIEVFNARCLYPEDNEKARAFAQTHNVPGTAGSDAHTVWEYGKGVLCVRPFDSSSPADFLAALRDGKPEGSLSSSLVHVGSKLAKWSKKLGLKPRQWAGG